MKIEQIKTKNGRAWEVVGYIGKQPDGKRQRAKKRGFATKSEAVAWFEAERVAFKNGTSKYNAKQKDASALTLEDVFTDYWHNYVLSTQESTQKKELWAFEKYVLPELGRVEIANINALMVQNYYIKLRGQILHYKPVGNAFRKLLNYAHSYGLIADNPATGIKMPKEREDPKKKRQFMNANEFTEFIEVCTGAFKSENQQGALLLYLEAMTGVRSSEALALTWDAIDWDKSQIAINKALGVGYGGQQYIKPTKTKTSSRVLTVPAELIAELSNYYDQVKPQEKAYIFADRNGKPLNQYAPGKLFKYVSEQYSVAKGLTPHSLRHTWATLALENGATVKQVQNYLGHSKASTTLNIYAGLTDQKAEETGNILTKLTQKLTQNQGNAFI